MKYLNIHYRQLVYLTSFTVFSGDIKKRALKKSSENDKSTGHFQSFFIYFFCPPTLDLIFFPRKSTKKKFWPYAGMLRQSTS